VQVHIVPLPENLAAMGDSGGTKLRLILQGLLSLPTMTQYREKLIAAIRRIKPDVIHSNGAKSHLLLGVLGLKIPAVFHIHDFLGARPMIAWILGRLLRGRPTIAVSNAVAEDIRKWLPGSDPQLVLNCIDVDRFSPADGDGHWLDQLCGMRSVKPEPIRIGLVATYARWKGQDVFIRAALKVVKQRPEANVRFYIVGGPIYSTRGSQFSAVELLRMGEDEGVIDCLGLIPFQSNMPRVYRSLDIVVHASIKPEPFGLTVVEAMSCGRPVIVSAAGGACELFEEGQTALGIPPGNSAAMAGAILALLDDPGRRIDLAQSSRQWAAGHFDHRGLGPDVLRIYRNPAIFLTKGVRFRQ
jgi:glycosyltransferase involved in cell wall biosynthesis